MMMIRMVTTVIMMKIMECFFPNVISLISLVSPQNSFPSPSLSTLTLVAFPFGPNIFSFEPMGPKRKMSANRGIQNRRFLREVCGLCLGLFCFVLDSFPSKKWFVRDNTKPAISRLLQSGALSCELLCGLK